MDILGERGMRPKTLETDFLFRCYSDPKTLSLRASEGN
jgi:hypothetical protein